MTVLGLGHGIVGGHHGLAGGHTPVGGHGHASLPSQGHGPIAHHSGTAAISKTGHHLKLPSSPGDRALASKLLLAVSPIDVFSLALGAGATGIFLGPLIPANWLVWCAVLGAIVFDFGVVKPLIGFLARFVSRPSDGLEGQVAQMAEAISAFDHNGRGLVKLALDGQIVQLLANLDTGERERGIPVAKGDTVLVIEVDPGKNSCKVSRELASQLADDAAYASSQARK
jgi:hypothetical protein